MKLISWNVNGFRSVLTKGFGEAFEQLNADIFCLQETKMQPGQASFEPEGYYQYWNSAEKKGYSGTAVFTKVKPISAVFGIDAEEHSHEGRAITLEYDNFYLVNVYTPNSQAELTRLSYRCTWEDELRNYLCRLNAVKPVIYCGDLNVAHNDIDLKNPKPNRGCAGFTDEERNKLQALLDSGFKDSFRVLYPDKPSCYSWWSYMRNARANNAGWRIDYFIVSDILAQKIAEADIYTDIFGSDHCPVGLTVNI
ncbi:MAG: exodeoxyribonuclease III [Oscillospiraceae bacterium]